MLPAAIEDPRHGTGPLHIARVLLLYCVREVASAKGKEKKEKKKRKRETHVDGMGGCHARMSYPAQRGSLRCVVETLKYVLVNVRIT